LIVSIVMAALVTVAMGAVAWLGWRRWPHIDTGARWIVGGVWASFGLSLAMLVMVVLHRHTRVAHEFQLVLNTTATLLGFACWQPRPVPRRILLVLTGLFVVTWLAVWRLAGWDDPFSVVSAPIAHTLKTAAAGFTLIVLVRVTAERWTRQLWFWFATAVMLIYGTEVILDPFWQRAFGSRDDLLLAAYVFNQLAGLVGYGLMARGLWTTTSARRPDSL
jgi:hypothetical protein